MKSIVFGSLAAMLLAGSAHAAVIVGVDEQNNLVTFNTSAPGTVLSTVAITGVSASLQGLDFRPLNNVLYGLGGDRVIYSINTATGAATAVSGVLALNGSEFAFDFNPTIDRLRIVSNTNENYVFDPNSGTLTTATAVAYATGDVNFGRDPDVTGAAYTSSTFGAAAATTQLYAIDTALDVLTRQANSAGTLTTVGSLGLNLGSRTSFDILGTDAFAVDGNRVYSVNLTTGALTAAGTTDRSLFGIALVSPVPEPATWGMMIAGFAAAGATLRTRRRNQLATRTA